MAEVTGMSPVPNLWLPISGSHSKHAGWEWPDEGLSFCATKLGDWPCPLCLTTQTSQ